MTPIVTGFVKKATQKEAVRSSNKNGRNVLLVVAAIGVFLLIRSRF